jgi:hypothetical protein
VVEVSTVREWPWKSTAANTGLVFGILLDQFDENGGLGVRLGLGLFPFAQGGDLARRYFRADLEKLGGKKVVSSLCKHSEALEYMGFQ